MELTLRRQPSTDKCTIGALFINSRRECATLEDIVRETKIPGRTAIPAGRYEITITYSKRFCRALPLLLNVPGFDGVRIHPGNTDADTEGCILVGKSAGQDKLFESREAFSLLMLQLQRAIQNEKIFITVEDAASEIARAA